MKRILTLVLALIVTGMLYGQETKIYANFTYETDWETNESGQLASVNGYLSLRQTELGVFTLHSLKKINFSKKLTLDFHLKYEDGDGFYIGLNHDDQQKNGIRIYIHNSFIKVLQFSNDGEKVKELLEKEFNGDFIPKSGIDVSIAYNVNTMEITLKNPKSDKTVIYTTEPFEIVDKQHNFTINVFNNPSTSHVTISKFEFYAGLIE
jgi:hypothetical protein